MFKLKENRYLPRHILYYQYSRPNDIKRMPEEDKSAIQAFYEENNIKYKDLTTYQQNIIFKRTVTYIYIVAHFYDKKPYARMRIPEAVGETGGVGVVRTQAYIFHKSGSLLYELDHDYQTYADNQIEEKKLNKRNYELHEELNNNYLKEIGNKSQNFIRFDKACHELLKNDDALRSVEFITEEDK